MLHQKQNSKKSPRRIIFSQIVLKRDSTIHKEQIPFLREDILILDRDREDLLDPEQILEGLKIYFLSLVEEEMGDLSLIQRIFLGSIALLLGVQRDRPHLPKNSPISMSE